MDLLELYRLIDLQPEIVQKLKVIGARVDLDYLNLYLERLMDMETAPQAYQYLNSYFEGDRDHLKMLYCQLECARRSAVKYREKCISETVFVDTMKCFSRFIGECEKKNGRLFFDRGWWTYRQISMNIFRIGSLEYQLWKRDNERVIDIHIPSDADLSGGAVERSLEQAERFFQTYYGDYKYTGYACDSWLLSPALRPFLSPQSNILAFQERFHILHVNREDKEYMEWLFQVPADTDYEDLPEGTHLQREVKKLLLGGGAVGSACGIIRI